MSTVATEATAVVYDPNVVNVGNVVMNNMPNMGIGGYPVGQGSTLATTHQVPNLLAGLSAPGQVLGGAVQDVPDPLEGLLPVGYPRPPLALCNGKNPMKLSKKRIMPEVIGTIRRWGRKLMNWRS